MQDIDPPGISQASIFPPAVHVPRPTAREAWEAMHQSNQLLQQREGIMQGSDQPVTVLVRMHLLRRHCMESNVLYTCLAEA